MPSPFEEAIAGLSSADRAALSARLAQWSRESALGARIPSNLRAERFLPAAAMTDLLGVIVKHAASPHALLESNYRTACYSQAMQGGCVKLTTLPEILGRAVDKRVWANHIINRHLKLFGNKSLVLDFIERLIDDPGYSISYPESQALMSAYGTWVTWNEKDVAGDPFLFRKTDRADEIRACMGLVTPRRGRSPFLLLLTYKRPAATALVRPTVADAATYPFFRPPLVEQGDAHGWTLPWPTEDLNLGLAGVEPGSRPEALHNPLAVELLRLPLICLT